jgi:hypothetical protein
MACAVAGVLQPGFQSPVEQAAGLHDLLELAAESIDENLLMVLRRLCAEPGDCFTSAREAAAALKREPKARR